MIIFKYAGDVMHHLNNIRQINLSIGFIPTMGALHEGHTSLLKKSKVECELTVCSIFINPTQFTNADDFKKYPVTLENDIYTLEKNGCDILFLPEVKEMYPNGTLSKKHFDLDYLETILEGEFRPGHFQGVCQVVNRLLEIIGPTHLFMGQKDYQQCLVIKRLLALENLEIELVICETLRETNGLAMSSRNLRLSEKQKEQASHIYKMLLHVKQNIKTKPLHLLKKEGTEYLISNGFKPDYVEIATASSLHPADEWDGKTELVILAAAFVDDVRLIDNMILKQ